jgi:hypothetical protein
MKTRFLLFISLFGHVIYAQQNENQVVGDSIRRIQEIEGIVVSGLRAKDAPNNVTITKKELQVKKCRRSSSLRLPS